MARQLSYTAAVREAMQQCMARDPNVICFGLGVDDPKRIFGTTAGLQEEFGKDRVFDMPTSENAMTGIGIGASLTGIRPVMVHQRLDFFLLALEQLVNNAAKWHYMLGAEDSAAITIRLIVGQGWGQGPTHSQNLHAWFAHIPGLRVVIPTNPFDAKGLLVNSIFDPNPVVFIEHRWLHNSMGEVPEVLYRIPFGKARKIAAGKDLTIVSTSYLTVEAVHALEYLRAKEVHCDLIDLRSVSPVDWESISESVKKTGRLLVLDTAHCTGSFAAEIIARVCMQQLQDLKAAPRRITFPDFPSPTSHALSRHYYPRVEHIVGAVGEMLGRDLEPGSAGAERDAPHDVPGDWFTGPF